MERLGEKGVGKFQTPCNMHVHGPWLKMVVICRSFFMTVFSYYMPFSHLCNVIGVIYFPRLAIWEEHWWDRTVACPICLSAPVSIGKTGDWMRMQFGVVRGLWLGMRVLTVGGYRLRRSGSLGWMLCRNGVLRDNRRMCEKLTISDSLTGRLHFEFFFGIAFVII